MRLKLQAALGLIVGLGLLTLVAPPAHAGGCSHSNCWDGCAGKNCAYGGESAKQSPPSKDAVCVRCDNSCVGKMQHTVTITVYCFGNWMCSQIKGIGEGSDCLG